MMRGSRMVFLLCMDILGLVLALVLVGLIWLPSDLYVFRNYTGASFTNIGSYLLFFYIVDAYRMGHEDFRDTLVRTLVACVLGCVLAATVSFLFDYWRFKKIMVLSLGAIVFCISLGWRFLYYIAVRRWIAPLRILLVGFDKAGSVHDLLAANWQTARIVGYVGEPGEKAVAAYLGPSFQTLEKAREHNVDFIVLLPDAPLDDDIARELLTAKLQGTQVVDIRLLYEHVGQRLPLSQITDEWLLVNEGFSLNTRGALRRLKRVMDVFFAMLVLLCTFPLMLLLYVLIRRASPGSVIYRQRRVGLNEKGFTLYKFRSMIQDADAHGTRWTVPDDARVTRIGSIIRQVRLAELPQLWNILRGDMSFIGPRPERELFVRKLKRRIPYYSLRHSVKPGLTGWAQVSCGYASSEEGAREKLEYDLYYIKNMSIVLDLRIFLKTLGVVIFPKGAR